MRCATAILWLLLLAGCVSPFPIRTCQDAKRAVVTECGHPNIEGWTCWDEITLRGTGPVLSAELFSCLDGATTCFEVESCLENHKLLQRPGIVSEERTAPPPYESP